MRPTDMAPKVLIDELLRCYRLTPEWMVFEDRGNNTYECRAVVETWTRKLWKSGADAWGMKALSHWLGGGPKVFRPTEQQCRAMENVEINLPLADYAQPFPALAVEFPAGLYSPYHDVLCYKEDKILILCLNDLPGHLDDVVTTIGGSGHDHGAPIEQSILRYDDDVKALHQQCGRVSRVALNCCLALANYGSRVDFLFPREVENDRRLAKERTERGERARQRLPLAPQIVTFSQDVVLHRTRPHRGEPGEPTGREVGPHWRRGHWAMQAHGPGYSQRRLILRPPVLVRADRFGGDASQTGAVYHT